MNLDSTYNTGDIYLGKVVGILDNLNVAFIKLDEWKQNGFMVIKDDLFLNLKKNINLGEEIIVQITKEQVSKKGPTISQEIIIENEEIKAYLYNKNNINFGKESDINNKRYLQTISKLIKPKKFGLVIKKTNTWINIWKIIHTLNKIEKELLLIKLKIKNNKECPKLISSKQKIIDLILKQSLLEKKTILIVESKKQALNIKKQLYYRGYGKNNFFIEYCNKKTSKKYHYYIENIIKNGLQSDIQLNTGGHIIIEKTEAFTSIDVNSGSFNKFGSSRETILWMNIAASKEIIHQIKLKNISGIIVIDFIDMINQDDQLALLEYLNTQLQSNFSGSQIIQISEIGLVEITKQREGRNIYDMFTNHCLICNGIGKIREEKLSNKISRYLLEFTYLHG